MKKIFHGFVPRYILVGVLLVFVYISFASVWANIKNSVADIAATNLSDDAVVVTDYLDDKIDEKMHHLEQLSKLLAEVMFRNSSMTRTALSDYKGIFSSIEVLSTLGQKEYGDDIAVDLAAEGILGEVVVQCESVVSDSLVLDPYGDDAILFAVPVLVDGEPASVVIATVPVKELEEQLNVWGGLKSGCAFLITRSGKYLTGGDQFDEILGGEANSFFTYLSKCKFSGEVKSTSAIERRFQNDEQFAIYYRYDRTDYIGMLCPSQYGDWYVVSLESVKVFYSDAFKLSVRSIILLVIAILFLAALVAGCVYGIYMNFRYRTSLERYEIIQHQENSILFEFRFNPKRLRLYGRTKELFGTDKDVLIGEEVYEVYDYLHEDDRSVRGRIHAFYDEGHPGALFSAEVRIRNVSGTYSWHKIVGSLIKDEITGENIKFIGKIENAEEEIAEEKNLVQRAENDMLTGVLNKKTMEEKTTAALANLSGNHHCIFFMIDLDNFKNVNDKLGHVWGDKAIIDTANLLMKTFPENAYIGRLGGDEFAVCAMYDAFDRESLIEYIKKKADRVCEVNRRTYGNNNISVSISSSVGVAIAPEDASDWDTLYRLVDSALYVSKNGGKNRYTIHGQNNN